MKELVLFGIPVDLGAENLGVDIGPNAFRYRGIIEKLERIGFSIEDKGNIECRDRSTLHIGNPKLKYLDEILRISNDSSQKVFKNIKEKKIVVVLGGDHSLSLGTISGASDAVNGTLGLIYLDAHGDLNTDITTLTGNIHGMHVASLLGLGDKRLREVHSKNVKIKKDRLLHIGGYDLDPEERALIKKEKITMYEMIDILSDGCRPLFKQIDLLCKSVKNIWVSLDLDVIDALYAPGAGMPNKAGLTYREITLIADYIGKKANIIGLDVVEYNPLQDNNGMTAELGIELIAKLLGGNYSWYTNYLAKNSA